MGAPNRAGRNDPMILSIRLRNWRSHEDSSLQFSKGANLLIGIMGSGKSSVLDAVSFALFGTTPLVEKRKQSLEDLVRSGENSASVSLEFQWNGSKFLVERSIEKDQSGKTRADAKLYEGGRLLEKGSRAVTQQIEDLIRVDYPLFSRAIYSEQNNIDYFMNVDAGRRKEEMDRLLGLDRFESARAGCGKILNAIKDRVKTIRSQYSPEETRLLRERFSKSESDIASLRASLQEEQRGLDSVRSASSSLDASFKAMEKKRSDSMQMQRSLSALQAKSKYLAERVEERKVSVQDRKSVEESLIRSEAKLSAIREDLLKKEAEQKELARSIGALEKSLADAQRIQKSIAEMDEPKLSKDLASLHAELSLLEPKLLELSNRRDVLKHSIADQQDLLGKLSDSDHHCPLCASPLGESRAAEIRQAKYAQISSLKGELLNAESELSKSSLRIKELKPTLQSLQEKQSKLSYLKRDLKDPSLISAGLSEHKSRLSSLDTAPLKAQVDALLSEKQSLSRQLEMSKELERTAAEKEKADSEARLLEKQISMLGFDEKTFEALREQASSARLSLAKSEGRFASLSSELKGKEESAKLISEKLKHAESLMRKEEALRKKEEELSIYRTALLETQQSLRAELIEEINSAMNEIWGVFYPYGDYGRVRVNVTDRDYSFEVFSNSWKQVERSVSGGERACFALTFRVALAAVLTPNLGWLMLDEPTHNLDQDAVKLLSETLQEKVPEIVDQTFVITHDESLMGSDFASAYKFSRQKEKNGPTIAERI